MRSRAQQNREQAEQFRRNILRHLKALGMTSHADTHRVNRSLGPTPLWLDCDTGHDDAFAILLAARTPDVRLLGVSTVYGNASREHTTYNTRAILHALERTDVPVYAGADQPLSRASNHAPDIHGASGLDGTTCLPNPEVEVQTDMVAVDAMHQRLRSEAPGTAWLVATGPLTNIAALFDKHPALADHIRGLSIMGGAIGNQFTSAPMGKVQGEAQRFGNHTPYAEFNIYCDPEAARAIFSNRTLAGKTTLIPLDLTHQFLATNEVQKGLLLGFGEKLPAEPTMESVSIIRRLYFEILNFFTQTYADVFGFTNGPPTHDPLAIAATFKPDLFFCNPDGRAGGEQHERFEVRIEIKGAHGPDALHDSTSQCGRTVIKVLERGVEGVRIPRGLDVQALWSLLEAALTHTEKAIKKSSTEFNATDRRPTASQHPSGGAGGDMLSLVPNSTTTLSQFEQNSGVFPDIKGAEVDQGGDYLTTHKEGKMGISPKDLTEESTREAEPLMGGV